MLNRSVERSKAAVAKLKQQLGAEADVSFVLMDLASLESVRTAAAEVLESVPQIDALVCNAAIAQVPSQMMFAYDKPVMERLWVVSEKETGFNWTL